MTIDPATSLANVELVVGDLDAQAGFYRDAIGLRELRRGGGVVGAGSARRRRPARDARRATRTRRCAPVARRVSSISRSSSPTGPSSPAR